MPRIPSLLYAAAVPGPVALVGAGEFLAPMAEFDRGLLESTGRSRPRVVILPTASAVDGERTFRTWAEMGVEHFSALGAEVEPVLVRTAVEGHDAAALQAIGEADLIYLSGGHPRHLLRVLQESPMGVALAQAHARGAAIAGCSAGAMAIVGRTMDFRFLPRVKVPLPFPVRWPVGLSLVEGVAVLPHYDAWPEPLSAFVALQAPRGSILLGIDEETAVIGRNGAWQVHGRGRVTVWRGRHRERFRKGDAFRL
jgi:cyanophycinase